MTTAVRVEFSIGNVSEAARELNDKLARAGDHRRVVCSVQNHINNFGEVGKLGKWELVGGVRGVLAA